MNDIRRIHTNSVEREIFPILNEIEPEARNQATIIAKEWLLRV